MTALQQRTWLKAMEQEAPERETAQQNLFIFHSSSPENIPERIIVPPIQGQADSDSTSVDERTSGSVIRKHSYSEINEPILATFFSRNSKKDTAERDDVERHFSGDSTQNNDPTPVTLSVSEEALAKADQLFTMDWDNFKGMSSRFGGSEVSDSESTKEGGYVMEVKLPGEDQSVRPPSRRFSSPVIDQDVGQIFDYSAIFERVESMNSEASAPESVQLTPPRKSTKTQIKTSNLIRQIEIKELETQFEKSQTTVKSLARELDIVKNEKLALETDARAFQGAIDQLVAEVVRLEDECAEKQVILSELWEECQVAQEAAKDRRRMLTLLRRDHAEELKRLQVSTEKEIAPIFVPKPVSRSPSLRLNETHEPNGTETPLHTSPERSSTNALDDLITEIAKITGESHGSPRGQGNNQILEEDVEGEIFPGRKWSIEPQNPPAEPDSLNDSIFAKLTGISVPDEPFFKVTIEENTSQIPRMISFEISEEEANSSLETEESNQAEDSNNLSDLITAFLNNLSPTKQSIDSDQRPSSKLSFINECSEENLEDTSPRKTSNSLPFKPRNRRWNRTSRSHSAQRHTHQQRRSWSAPPAQPNQTLCISLLSALRRVSKAKQDKEQGKKRLRRSKSAAGSSYHRQSRKRYINTGTRQRTQSSDCVEERKFNNHVNFRPVSRLGHDKISCGAEGYISQIDIQNENFSSIKNVMDRDMDQSREQHTLLPSSIRITRDRTRIGEPTARSGEPCISPRQARNVTDYQEASRHWSRNLKLQSHDFSPPDERMRGSITPTTAKRIKGFSESSLSIRAGYGDRDYIADTKSFEEVHLSNMFPAPGLNLPIINKKIAKNSLPGRSTKRKGRSGSSFL